MIDYATYRRIHHLNESEALNVTQLAKRLALDPRTVRYWLVAAEVILPGT